MGTVGEQMLSAALDFSASKTVYNHAMRLFKLTHHVTYFETSGVVGSGGKDVPFCDGCNRCCAVLLYIFLAAPLGAPDKLYKLFDGGAHAH